jgi:hypothetical protein
MTREDCNDVVSRKAVINLILEDAVRTGTGHRYTSIQNMNNEINEVRTLPPVTPTRKEGVRDSVLDKIKAEIEALPKTYPFVNHIDMYVKVSDVTKIIDKYKAESNGQKNMKIWFCHVTGGASNYDFYGHLSESGIEYYRNQGCKVTRVEWQWKM